MATKSAQIIEMVDSDESYTQRAIAEKVGCTEGYVSKVMASYKTKNEQPVNNPNTEIDEDREIDNDVSNFIKRIKIEPDKDVLTGDDEDDDNDTEEYECGSCGHIWVAGKTDYQSQCPQCGEVF